MIIKVINTIVLVLGLIIVFAILFIEAENEKVDEVEELKENFS